MQSVPPAAQQFDQPRKPFLRLILVLASLLFTADCHSLPPGDTAATQTAAPPTDLQAEADLLARMTTEIGAARCTSDAQCRTLAVGEKACGGPAAWRPWSITTGGSDQLHAWAAKLAVMQRQRNERSGVMSNCQYLPDPGATCQAQQCVLRYPGAAN